jgi:hypothetical protein
LRGRSHRQESRLISAMMKIVVWETVLQKHSIRNKLKSLHILHFTSEFLIFILPPTEAHQLAVIINKLSLADSNIQKYEVGRKGGQKISYYSDIIIKAFVNNPFLQAL